MIFKKLIHKSSDPQDKNPSTVVSQQNYIATLKVLFIYQIIFILELLSTGDNHHQAAQK